MRVKIILINSVLLFAMASAVSGQTTGLSESYLERLKSGTEETKRDTLLELSRIGTAEASLYATRALQDTSAIVRATAIGASVSLSTDDAHLYLSPLLLDTVPFVRKEAISALGRSGSVLSAPKILSMLRTDKDREVRAYAAVALGRIGSREAVPELVNILLKKPKDSTSFIRRASARSLGQIVERYSGNSPSEVTPYNFRKNKLFKASSTSDSSGFPSRDAAIRVLKTVIINKRESNDTRREAAFALGTFGDERSVAILNSFLSSKDYYLAEICREALRKSRN